MIGICIFRRGSDECNKKQPSDCDALEYRNGEGKNKFGLICILIISFLKYF